MKLRSCKWFRLSGMFMSLLILLGTLMPAFPAYADEDADEEEVISVPCEETVSEETSGDGATLRIGGREILPDDYGKHLTGGMSGGYAVYNDTDKTLTFFNDHPSIPVYLMGEEKDSALIWADQDLTILGKVSAENTKDKTGHDYGIFLSGKAHTLTIGGSVEARGYLGGIYIGDQASSLVVEDGATLVGMPLYDTEPEAGTTLAAINCNGNMTVNGTVDVGGLTHVIKCLGNMEVNGEASIRLRPQNPVYCDTVGLFMGAESTLTMNYGELLTSNACKGASISGAYLVMNGGNINVTGGTEDGNNVTFKNLVLNSGTFTAKKTTSGGAALRISGDLTVNGGTLYAEAADGSVALDNEKDPVLAEGVVIYDSPANKATIRRDILSEYPLWVGKIRVDEENRDHIPVKGGSASYDPETKILMFKDVTGVIGYTDEYILNKCMIYTQNNDLTISGNAVLRSDEDKSAGVVASNSSLTFSGNIDISTTEYGIYLRNGALKDIVFNGRADVNVNVTPSGDNNAWGILNAAEGGKIILDDDAKDVKVSVRVAADKDGKFLNNKGVGIAAYGDEHSATDTKPSVIIRKGAVDVAAGAYGIDSDDLLFGPEAEIRAEAASGHPAINWIGSINFPEVNHTVIVEPANAELSADGTRFVYNSGDTDKPVNYIRLGVYRLSVTFNMCGHGKAIEPRSILRDIGIVTRPEDPTEEGCIFEGWFTDPEYKNEFDFETKISTDITLYAKWRDSYTVYFEMCGHGTAISPQKVLIGKTAAMPAEPEDEEYVFEGWFKDAEYKEAYDFATPVSEDITLYAKWKLGISPMNPIPVIKADTDVLYLVKGQSFPLPEGKWNSDSNKIVKITKKGTFLQAKKETPAEPVLIQNETTKKAIRVYVKTPKFDKKKIKLQAGDSNKNAGLLYDKAHYNVLWTSSAPDVATVSANGAVNAVASGKATITAYIYGKAYSCTVNVTEDNAVTERTLHLNIGKSKNVKIKGVQNKKAEWSSENDNIAKVVNGRITAGEKTGTTLVSCKTSDGKIYKVNVTVEDPTIKSSRIMAKGKNKYELTLDKKGDKTKIEFNGVVQPVVFKSTAGVRAYMDRKGNIAANGKGKATLKAKINGTTVSIKVTVSE